MKCSICRHGETRPGTVSVMLERDALTLVVKNVPAQVCGNCGEEYLSADTTGKLLDSAESKAEQGVEFVVQQYCTG